MDLCVIGAGHVGLVSGACFADLGNDVVMVDNDAARIANLKKGLMPYYEPGLEELVRRGVKKKRLSFTTSISDGVAASTIIFIAVGTPQKPTGETDLAYVEAVARSIAAHLTRYHLIVEKSTVPVQTGRWIHHTIKTYLKRKVPFDVASNPEFLREGTAIQDTLKPDRVVLGVESQRARKLLTELYKPMGCPVVVTDIASAEMIKHASNSFLSMKISFINAVAQVCEHSGADVQQVAEGMGLDPRIGRAFLNAGAGFGGFCFAADESSFTLNSPHLSVQSFEQLFGRYPVAGTVNAVDVAIPTDGQTLSFDSRQGRPTLTTIRGLSRRWYEGPFVEIETMMGRRLRVTADHPVVVADRSTDRIRTVPAASVHEGHALLSPTTLPRLRRIRSIDLLKSLAQGAVTLPVKVFAADQAFGRTYARWRHNIPPALYKYPADIAKSNTMPWRVFTHLWRTKRIPVRPGQLRLFTSLGHTTTIPAQFAVNEMFMRWLGYYLAEGWISQEPGRNGAIRERIGFSFGRHEQAYLQDLHHMLSRYGIRYQTVGFPGAIATIASSRLLAWMLRDLLRCGTNSSNKQLPILAFNVGPRLRKALLQGLFSGDGSMTRLQHGRNMMFEYATSSKPLADGVVLLLQSVGVVPTIHQRWMNKSTRPAYIIRVNGVRQLRTLHDVFGPKRRREVDRQLRLYQRSIAQRGFLVRKHHVLLPVRRTRTYHDRGFVYSLETKNQLLVAGNGLVVHNCFPKDLEAFIKISEQLGYDFQLLKAVREINEEAKRGFAKKIQQALWVVKGKTIGVLGLAFKPNTDDMRYAPAIDVIESLRAEGAAIKAFDPQAMGEAKRLLPNVKLCKDAYEAARGADCLAILTEWNEFKELDFARIKKLLRQPLIVDGRNIYDPVQMRRLGFRYLGVGRGRDEAH
ncbi:MAG: nucleotide sugar dehydrogenase [Candidatus Omnitrophica bacterium]|nr:nucleotide sugar dehydrogenase [Candidatus Omnitrophota bacterium]